MRALEEGGTGWGRVFALGFDFGLGCTADGNESGGRYTGGGEGAEGGEEVLKGPYFICQRFLRVSDKAILMGLQGRGWFPDHSSAP